MAHMDLHPRGDHEPDVELHLYFHGVAHAALMDHLDVSSAATDGIAHKAIRHVLMDEPYVDYMDELVPGTVVRFLVPLGKAKHWGLVPSDLGGFVSYEEDDL